jgi:hypothetical protein
MVYVVLFTYPHVGANVRRYGLALLIGPNCVAIYLKIWTESVLRNVVLNKKTGRWIMSRNSITELLNVFF